MNKEKLEEQKKQKEHILCLNQNKPFASVLWKVYQLVESHRATTFHNLVDFVIKSKIGSTNKDTKYTSTCRRLLNVILWIIISSYSINELFATNFLASRTITITSWFTIVPSCYFGYPFTEFGAKITATF